MGFCRRCGEITIGDRCKCGGTSKEPAVKPLFASGGADKWGQRYLARTPSPSSAPTSGSSSTAPSSPTRPPLRPTSSSRPPSPSKLRSFTGAPQGSLNDDRQFEFDAKFNTFGSTLSPQDNWCCVSCEKKFVQESTLYPHPEAKVNPELKDVYFCRPCFADRFAKGVCKKCKCAVLSDAPFIKHDDRLWHDTCFVCSYCSATEDIIMDFASDPSCEECFDSAAYKTHRIPPSPHLAQGSFFAPPKLKPAPSKWGSDSVSKNVGNVYTSAPVDKGETGKATRLRMEREKSPMVPSFNELGERLRKAGLDDSPTTTIVRTVSPTRTKAEPKSLSKLVETTRPLATSSPFVRPAPPPVAAQVSTPYSSTAGTRPTHARSLNTNVGLRGATSPGTTSISPSRPSHQRAWSLNTTPAPPASGSVAPLGTPNARPKVQSPFLSAPLPPSKVASPFLPPAPPSSAANGPASTSNADRPRGRGTPLSPTVPRPRLHVSQETSQSSSAKQSKEEDEICPACEKPLGYGEFAQLKSGEVLHRTCFVCAGCSKMLDVGRHAQVEGKVWHAECAPAPQRHRSIVTSLVEPSSPSSSSPTSPNDGLLPSNETPTCSSCSKDLGVSHSITVPRSGKSYHVACFTCGGCGRGFTELGAERGLVERKGQPFHVECAPTVASSTPPPSRSHNPWRASTSRALPLPPAPPQPKIFHPPPRSAASASLSLPKSPSQASIFATRPRPPSGLGGLLICSGCSVHATQSETVKGPRGARYHPRCLVCSVCRRGLDSEAKLTEAGELRCEGCRKVQAQSNYKGVGAVRVV